MKRDVVSLFPYVGGKTELALKLVEMIQVAYTNYPIIDTYIEPCGGGGRVILNLPRRGTQIYSDWNPCLCSLFWTVSNSALVYKLIELLESKKFEVNESNYVELHKKYLLWTEINKNIGNFKNPIIDHIESAAYTYYLTRLSYNGRVGSPGFYSISEAGMETRNEEENLKIIDAYWRSIERLPDFSEILDGVLVRSGDVRRFLYECDTPNFLIYIDAPYIKDTYIHSNVLAKTNLVIKSDYEQIKSIMDNGGIPVFVKSQNNQRAIDAVIKDGGTPVFLCSEEYTKRIVNLVKNNEIPMFFDYHNIAKTFDEVDYSADLRKDYTGGVNVRIHMDIVTLARKSNAHIMISGYDNSIYDYLLESPKWHKIKMDELAVVSSTKSIKTIETEYLWLNF